MSYVATLKNARHTPADHPGKLLRDYVLPGLELTMSEAARDLGISRQTLYRVIDGTFSVTPEMAARLERLCCVPAMFWLQLQGRYELARVEIESADMLAHIPRRTLPRKHLQGLGGLCQLAESETGRRQIRQVVRKQSTDFG